MPTPMLILGFHSGAIGAMVNQGPLLGLLFIIGPLGFIAGEIGGGIYWAVRRGRDGSHH